MLGKVDGTFIKADSGKDFLFYLDNEDVVLTAGDYVVMIDPIWNQCAEKERFYKLVNLDIYCPDQIDITPIDDRTGMRCLANMLKNFA